MNGIKATIYYHPIIWRNQHFHTGQLWPRYKITLNWCMNGLCQRCAFCPSLSSVPQFHRCLLEEWNPGGVNIILVPPSVYFYHHSILPITRILVGVWTNHVFSKCNCIKDGWFPNTIFANNNHKIRYVWNINFWYRLVVFNV